MPWEMHGHNLRPLLEQPEREWPHPVLLTLTGRSYGADTDKVPSDPAIRDLNGIPWWVFLVRGRYKYIRTLVEGEREELYDLKKDPEELTNLALKPEYAQIVSRFRRATIQELQRTEAGMVHDLPPVKK